MNNVPKELKDKWQSNPAKKCLRADEGDCKGRLTKEHVLTWKGKQIQEDWNILDICAYHHAVDQYQDCGKMNKEKHIWLALNRCPTERLIELSKAENYILKKELLNKKYGR
ncbi:MAG: hypothetical protein ACR2IQ_02695 [Minisyncoccia bacterium]